MAWGHAGTVSQTQRPRKEFPALSPVHRKPESVRETSSQNPTGQPHPASLLKDTVTLADSAKDRLRDRGFPVMSSPVTYLILFL